MQLDFYRNEATVGASTFAPNLKLPVHRWFRYSAGFSANWVKSVLTDYPHGLVLDPFAGSGTTLLAADECGRNSVGLEAHPFIYRVAQAKLCWDSSTDNLQCLARQIVERSEKLQPEKSESSLLLRCYTPAVFTTLDTLRQSVENSREDSAAWRLCWLAFVSVLRECSHVGTAQWQYILPGKRKQSVSSPTLAFQNQIQIFIRDMCALQTRQVQALAQVACADARNCTSVEDSSIGLVITSPPYANNYDYADATRLEMTFMREISGWSDLQDGIRKHLVRSCSQHVSAERLDFRQVLAFPGLSPIQEELTDACNRLSAAKETHGGKKAYDAMAAAYFSDMSSVWKALRRVCFPGATAAFVLGDSAPYGIHLPVDRWMGELAVAAGFKTWNFEKWRDRNTKWKNRKHRVPLKEGILWVRG